MRGSGGRRTRRRREEEGGARRPADRPLLRRCRLPGPASAGTGTRRERGGGGGGGCPTLPGGAPPPRHEHARARAYRCAGACLRTCARVQAQPRARRRACSHPAGRGARPPTCIPPPTTTVRAPAGPHVTAATRPGPAAGQELRCAAADTDTDTDPRCRRCRSLPLPPCRSRGRCAPPPASDPARRWATPPPRGRCRPPGLLPASIGEGSGGAEPALYMKGRGRRGARLLCAPWAPLCSPRRCSRPCPRSLPHPPHAAPQRGRAHPDHPGAAGHGARPGPARAAHRGLDLSPPLARPPARHGPREGQGRRRQLEEIHLELGEEGAAGPHRRQLV